MQEEREKIQKEIEATETSNLVPGMNETDLAQALVLQFLQHDGYVETARGFAEEIQAQKQALNLDPDVTIDGINIKDDEDANNRQRERLSSGQTYRLLTRMQAFGELSSRVISISLLSIRTHTIPRFWSTMSRSTFDFGVAGSSRWYEKQHK